MSCEEGAAFPENAKTESKNSHAVEIKILPNFVCFEFTCGLAKAQVKVQLLHATLGNKGPSLACHQHNHTRP